MGLVARVTSHDSACRIPALIARTPQPLHIPIRTTRKSSAAQTAHGRTQRNVTIPPINRMPQPRQRKPHKWMRLRIRSHNDTSRCQPASGAVFIAGSCALLLVESSMLAKTDSRMKKLNVACTVHVDRPSHGRHHRRGTVQHTAQRPCSSTGCRSCRNSNASNDRSNRRSTVAQSDSSLPADKTANSSESSLPYSRCSDV